MPVVVFFSTIVSVLYYLGVMQFLILKIAWVMQKTLGTTVPESVNAAGNIFIGQVCLCYLALQMEDSVSGRAAAAHLYCGNRRNSWPERNAKVESALVSDERDRQRERERGRESSVITLVPACSSVRLVGPTPSAMPPPSPHARLDISFVTGLQVPQAFVLEFLAELSFTAILNNRDFKKWKFSFFCQRHALWTSFGTFVVTYRGTSYRGTNVLPKLVNILLFFRGKKLNFHFLKSLFSTVAVVLYFQTEAPLLIRPMINDMTTSELHAVMVGGFATIAGSVMATYILFGVRNFFFFLVAPCCCKERLYLSLCDVVPLAVVRGKKRDFWAALAN